MSGANYYHYFVEGQNEQKLIKVLKTDMQLIQPGKVQVFNVVQDKLSSARLMMLKAGTTVVLVFDTDAGQLKILRENIALLNQNKLVEEVICITQVNNLEDELMRSCRIKQITELTGSKSKSDFKRDMLQENRFAQKLEEHQFDINKFWNSTAGNEYAVIPNQAFRIKFT